MSSQELVVRPYRGVERIGRALSGCFLMMTDAHRVDPGHILRLSNRDFLSLPAELWLAKDEHALRGLEAELRTGLEECEVEPDDAELLVVLSTPRLKLAEVLVRHGLDEPLASPHLSLTAEQRPAPLRTPVGGCRVDVYVSLATNLVEGPLRPWRKGTWLAHEQFDVRTDVGEFGFIPLPLTNDMRRSFGIPSWAARHVVVHDPLVPYEDAQVIEIYVDEEVLQQLAHRPTTAAAAYLQRQLFLDAMSAVLLEASASDLLDGCSWGDVQDTLLGRLLHRIAGPASEQTDNEHRARCESLLRLLSTEPSKVLSWVESLIPDLTRSMGELLRGES